MQGLKPHRLYGASNWLESKTPSNYLFLSPSLPHSLPLYSSAKHIIDIKILQVLIFTPYSESKINY